LIVGPDGVSIVSADDEAVTVRYDECALAAVFPDGGRVLIGFDAISLPVEPTLYQDLAQALPELDARIAPADRVDLPARMPEQIPRPDPAGPANAKPATVSRGKRWRRSIAVLFFFVAGFGMLLFGLFFLLGWALSPKDVSSDVVAGVADVISFTVAGFLFRRAVRNLRLIRGADHG
jgi:zinc protease